MNRFTVLLQKEWLDAKRSYKLLWLPVVFVFLGILQPLSSFYLPEILKMAGGLPDGMTITLPELTASEVLASALTDQFDQMGLIVIVMATMGIIATDKNNGMLAFILTRNTTLVEYLLSKLVGHAVIIAGSIFLGFLTTVFYTSYLYQAVSVARIVAGVGVYYIWCLFMLAFVIAIGALLSRTSAIALLSIFVLIFLKTVTLLGGGFQILNPAYLSNQAVSIITSGNVLPHFFITIAAAVLLIVFCLLFATSYLSRKELPSM
ncbi:ABC transporter permease [Bacillus sp. J14TS2]|uniref:ABC transporter permease n=1 Tax=Bacillus sp. J14TS2 TaxID=2807188 RepID=UPI001B17C49A|nr:ABC transporter permease subunit [Bacillus sp. J14TS2]GIN74814.1 ABC transporter permease [Bacillus sp. J14TS2]